MKDNYTANKYTNGILGEHIPKRKFQLFKRGATSPGVYSSTLVYYNYCSRFNLKYQEIPKWPYSGLGKHIS